MEFVFFNFRVNEIFFSKLFNFLLSLVSPIHQALRLQKAGQSIAHFLRLFTKFLQAVF